MGNSLSHIISQRRQPGVAANTLSCNSTLGDFLTLKSFLQQPGNSHPTGPSLATAVHNAENHS